MNKAVTLFRIALSLVIFIQSGLTVVHSLHSETQSHLGTVLPWFAGLEAIAAIMLLIPQTLKVGGVILLLIFTAALVVHGPADEMFLFVYAAGVILLMANGGSYRSRP